MEFPLKSMKLTFSRGLYRVVLERPRLLRLWRLLRIPRWCVFDSHPRWDPCLSLCPENHPIWARNERILQRKFNWSTYCNIVIFERTPKPKRAWNNIEGSKQTLNVSWVNLNLVMRSLTLATSWGKTDCWTRSRDPAEQTSPWLK